MAITTTMRVMILVKAAPILTSRLQESTCVAAVPLPHPPWIRLHHARHEAHNGSGRISGIDDGTKPDRATLLSPAS